MKTLIDVLVENVSQHAQQLRIHQRRLVSALEELDETRASFRDWLRGFLYIEGIKTRVGSLEQLLPGAEDLFSYLENAQAIMAKKLVTARKNKHEALLFSVLCRHAPIVRRAETALRPRRRRARRYRVVEESPEVLVLRA